MHLWQIVWREILHRKLNFLLALMAVMFAVGCVVSSVALLRGQELKTHQRVAALDNEIRKITKSLGFNIFILPAEQNLAEFHSADFAAKTMPEEYVEKLAQSRDVMTVNHLRPALIRKMNWPEHNRQIVLMGVRGVVPFAHRTNKKPLALPVAPGKINVGYELARQLEFEAGHKVTLADEDFQIETIYPARGNIDDITVWIDLAKAQEMLDMQGQINMIQALECNCESLDRLGDIQREISGVLGSDIQVIELATKAIARAKARNEVAANGRHTLQEWQRFAAVALPLVILAAAIWIALLLLANVRQRREEIGLWRALGWRSRRVFALFLVKAMLIGFAGALIGCALGTAIGVGFARSVLELPGDGSWASSSLVSASLLAAVVILTPLVAAVASWLPALAAAYQDPAVVLREE